MSDPDGFRTVDIDGEPVTFQAFPDDGVWYEDGGKIGTLYAPMLLNGSFDPDDIAEIAE